MSLTKVSYSMITGAPVNIQDFGAVGDGVVDDTAAIQAAIDFAYAGGVGRANAVYVPAGNYVCGQITTHPYTTIIGTGRHTSNFFCKTGTTGIWWGDRGNGAQKLMLSGLAWYGKNNGSLTRIAEFGTIGVQYGTEGLLSDLWFRDAPNAIGLSMDSNVGVYRYITVQTCDINIKILGNANQVLGIASVDAKSVGAELYGCSVEQLEIEATASGGIPLKMYGDVNVKNLVIATASGFTHSSLIEVNNTIFTSEWSVQNVILLGSGYTVFNGILKVGANYYGGTTPNNFTGTSYLPSITLYEPKIELVYQRLQAFNVRLFNDGGTLKHRIGASGDSAFTTSLDSKINGASNTFTVTPTGANATTAFAAGAKIGNPATSAIIFDTNIQALANAVLSASIVYNDSTTALTVWPQFLSDNVNGVTRVRLYLQFNNATTGANYDLTMLPAGALIETGVLAFLA